MTFAGIELGGTKAIVVRGTPNSTAHRAELPTLAPSETLGTINALLRDWHEEIGLDAVGIAAFGPIRVNSTADDYGRIFASPKPSWSGANVLAAVTSGIKLPVALDTDVNAAALAERAFGAARGCGTIAYITIGTGVGVGLLADGRPLHGALQPEMGHIRLRREAGDVFAGNCPFHGDCIEGLIAGPALAARFGCSPGEIARDHPTWHFVAADLAELLAMLIVGLSVERIVVGGGVSLRQPHLLPAAIARVPALLAGYGDAPSREALARTIVPAALGNDAGPTGALLLAQSVAG